MFHSVARSASARGDLNFVVDRGQVGVDRSRTDDKLFGDVRIGESLCHQAQHLHFPCREVCRIGKWWLLWRSYLCLCRGYRWSSSSQGLLWCHAAPLCPRGSKILLTKLGARGGHCLLVTGAPTRWERCTEGFAQVFRSTP